jgi:O-methyltransferase
LTGYRKPQSYYRDILYITQSFKMRFMQLRNIFKALELCDWKSQRFLRLLRCNRRIRSGSHITEQAFMFSSLVNLSAHGAVVECGSYKGSTTAVLSVACKLTKRKLHVFDSFEGLPKPSEADSRHQIVGTGVHHVYEENAWAGSLEEVRNNIRKFGDLSVCDFHKGFFVETLPAFNEPIAFVFCDVDLRSSLETCVLHLWPLLVDNGMFFTHEASHKVIAELFFDRGWWETNLNCDAPGLVGGGSGLGLIETKAGFAHSALGFAVKNPARSLDSFQIGFEETYEVHL